MRRNKTTNSSGRPGVEYKCGMFMVLPFYFLMPGKALNIVSIESGRSEGYSNEEWINKA